MIGKSFFARTTPVFAAALNERSSLPPMSKTMPTLFFPASSSAPKSRVAQPPSSSEQEINRIRRSFRPMFIDFLRLDSLAPDQARGARLFVGAAIIAHSILLGQPRYIRNGGMTREELYKWLRQAAPLLIWLALALLSTTQLYSIFRLENRAAPLWRIACWQSS